MSYDKIRYERLRMVCTRALEESIKKSLDLEQIKKCYPTIASTEDGVRILEVARSQIVEFWFNNSIKEFDLIFKERDLEVKLNALDEIVHLAKARSLQKDIDPIEIDKLTPREIIEANKQYQQTETVNSLNLIYNQLCADNLENFNQLSGIFKQSEQLKSEIYSNATSLNKEIEVLKNDQTDVKINQLLDTILVDDL